MSENTQKIGVNRLTGAEFSRNIHVVTAEPGMPFERCLQADAWAYHAEKMNVADRIEVMADDMTWWAELIVMSLGRNWASVRKLRYVSLTTADVEQTKAGLTMADFTVKHRGPHRKWSVIRNSDQEVVFDGGQEQSTATNWLHDHLKTVA